MKEVNCNMYIHSSFTMFTVNILNEINPKKKVSIPKHVYR